MPLAQNRRHIVLIKKDFQFKLIGKFVLMNAVVLALFGGCLYLFFRSEVQANLASAHATYTSMEQMLFPIMLVVTLLWMVLSSIVISAIVLYTSHKIAGPMYRFKEALDALSRRDLGTLTSLRDGDQLQELADSLTALKSTLRADWSAVRTDAVAGADGKAVERIAAVAAQYKIQ